MDRSKLKFESRRPVVLAQNGMVACGQPLAANIGLDVLKRGGNAADAAVAVAAALNLLQPTSTGIGGDAFCLFYDAATKQVRGLNGSGRAPAALTLQKVNEDGFNENNPIPRNHGHSVTVPGAAAAWCDAHETFGSGALTLTDLLQPTIDLAQNGFPVTQLASHFWETGSFLLKDPNNTHGKDLLINGRAPKWGEIMRNPHLAQTFTELAQKGKSGFYEGRIAEAIVAAVQKFGGVMAPDDLKNHTSTFDTPISTTYKGVRVWEIPPNGQGIVALMALNILETYNLKEMGHNSPQYLHMLIEAVRLGFADALKYVADPSVVPVPITGMLSKDYAAQRRQLIDPDKAMVEVPPGNPPPSGTVYFTVVDGNGNACSFINSNYMGFGTGIVPEACGFTLQNRGNNFTLEPNHANVIAPNKRPYHTIIPAMLTEEATGKLLASYGVMGGFMQPQGHVQVLLNMLEFGMNPQEALDKPRFCVGSGHTGAVGAVSLEEGFPQSTLDNLKQRGHDVKGPVTGVGRALFGRGHVITRGAWWLNRERHDAADDPTVLWGGSDPRIDGLAIGY